MSISFYLVQPDGDLACRADHGACTVPEHLLDEDIAAYSWPGHCVECSAVNRDACEICTMDLNVSNDNATAILERLGVEFDWSGRIDPADLFARAVVGGVGRDDSGVAPTTSRGRGGATLIDGGIRPGYFADRLATLEKIASYAMEHGLQIAWG